MLNRGRFRSPGPATWRASTVLFDSTADLAEALAAMKTGDRAFSTYGTHGTPTITGKPRSSGRSRCSIDA